MSKASRAHCVGCGAVVSGRYCADCGERTEPHDYSMKHFIEEVIETTAHVDGRVFASFRSLLARPGQLATDFLAGRRKTQLGPVQMFVVCNVLYFLFLPLALQVPFTSTLRMSRFRLVFSIATMISSGALRSFRRRVVMAIISSRDADSPPTNTAPDSRCRTYHRWPEGE